MRVAMAIVPPSDLNLAVARQIGVEELVYYDMATMPLTLEELKREVERFRRYDLRLTVIECGPPIDRIVMGKEGRDAQIEQFKRSLDHMGRVGAEVLCYNFMPQVLPDAMVVRTTYRAPARGGALTTAFHSAELTEATVPHEEPVVPVEQMWDNLEYFLRRVLPAAESAGVRMAMHPDDPPLSPICSLNRILSSVAAFDRLIAISSSPANGIVLCQGCFLEMGEDLVAIAKRFQDRIHYAHFRDVAGDPQNFVETFPDDGPTDFPSVFREYRNLGLSVPIRVDHVPRLATEAGDNDGYGFVGHVFATGYLKGLLDGAYGKASARSWQAIPAEDRAAHYGRTPGARR